MYLESLAHWNAKFPTFFEILEILEVEVPISFSVPGNIVSMLAKIP